MPARQRIGFDSGEGILPIEQAGQLGESESDGVGSPSWFEFTLDKKAQLFPKK
jgi:hypothetical protein